MPNLSRDFYWERLFITSLIGAGGGAALAYLMNMDYGIFLILGVAVGVSFSTVMQTDKVYGIKKDKPKPPITLDQVGDKSFEEQTPDDIKGLE